jgi:hypothetical protein
MRSVVVSDRPWRKISTVIPSLCTAHFPLVDKMLFLPWLSLRRRRHDHHIDIDVQDILLLGAEGDPALYILHLYASKHLDGLMYLEGEKILYLPSLYSLYLGGIWIRTTLGG